MQKQNNIYLKNFQLKVALAFGQNKNLKKGNKSQIKIRLKTQIHEIQKYSFWDSGQIVKLKKSKLNRQQHRQ